MLGVVPYVHDLGIPEEDAVALDEPLFDRHGGEDAIDVAVIKLPLISNFDDFDPLAAEPGVHVRYVSSPDVLGRPDAVILPGTKSTIADLDWLRRQGLAQRIVGLAGEGISVVGICGGYQMLGRVIRDPDHVESALDEMEGLALLPVETEFAAQKATHRARLRVLGGPGWLSDLAGASVEGYEIHMGRTSGAVPWLEIAERSGQPTSVSDGAVSGDGRIWGCYLHGLFDDARLRRAWLKTLGWQPVAPAASSRQRYEVAFERLADCVERALDMEALDAILGYGGLGTQ